MLAGLVEKLLVSYFGEYIENLEKDKISLGVNKKIYKIQFQIWNGFLELKDILIKKYK